jgi:ubiquinone/menaquinone biosynthesis C-methylase UbiE
VAAAGVRPGQGVLDVGCGTGYLSRLVARSVGPHGVVVGIDSESTIQYARRKTASIGNCEFQVGAAEALPFPSDHFEVVVSGLVIHHYLKTCGCVRWARCGASFDQGVAFSWPSPET